MSEKVFCEYCKKSYSEKSYKYYHISTKRHKEKMEGTYQKLIITPQKRKEYNDRFRNKQRELKKEAKNAEFINKLKNLEEEKNKIITELQEKINEMCKVIDNLDKEKNDN